MTNQDIRERIQKIEKRIKSWKKGFSLNKNDLEWAVTLLKELLNTPHSCELCAQIAENHQCSYDCFSEIDDSHLGMCGFEIARDIRHQQELK